MRAHATMALILLAQGCVFENAAPLGVEPGDYATLIIGERIRGVYAPRLVDLREPDAAESLAYHWSADRETPLAFWKKSIEELRLIVPLQRPADGACEANVLRLATADRLRCPNGEGALVTCTSTPAEGVETMRWSEPDPCAPWSPLGQHARIDFDIQSTRRSIGSRSEPATGAATLVVPLGDGRVVLGQNSGGPPGEYEVNTELVTVRAPVTTTQTPALIRARTSTEWNGGAWRGPDSVWIASTTGILATFDARTGTITTVIPAERGARGIVDLATHPDEPERVYAVTALCGAFVREPGAAAWTTISPNLPRLPTLPSGLPIGECGSRVAVLAPGEALIAAMAADPDGRAPSLGNYLDNRDLLVRVRGAVATTEQPWPAADVAKYSRGMRPVRGVGQYTDDHGVPYEVVAGARFTREAHPEIPPYDYGAGETVMFTRRRDVPGAPWVLRVALPAEDEMGVPIAPVVLAEVTGVTKGARWRDFNGLFIGSQVSMYAVDATLLERRVAFPFARVEPPWHHAGQFPIVTRIRHDGDGGIIVATGYFNDARSDFEQRFHWWRPR